MSAVNITRVEVLNNPAMFVSPLQFEIEYECLQELADDLEWKLTYVGSAETDEHDQVLDSVLVGPVAVGSYRFIFQADAPNWTKIPQDDLLGVTIILLTCSYRNQEFIRVGYYVNSEYTEEELRENPPEVIDIAKVGRSILSDKPRVTRFQVDFDPVATIATPEGGPQQEGMATMQYTGGTDASPFGGSVVTPAAPHVSAGGLGGFGGGFDGEAMDVA